MSKPKTQPQLLEADIRRTVVEFMVLHGWRHFRTDPVSDRRRATGFGEKGMPDDLFLRYRSWVNGHPAAIDLDPHPQCRPKTYSVSGNGGEVPCNCDRRPPWHPPGRKRMLAGRVPLL